MNAWEHYVRGEQLLEQAESCHACDGSCQSCVLDATNITVDMHELLGLANTHFAAATTAALLKKTASPVPAGDAGQTLNPER